MLWSRDPRHPSLRFKPFKNRQWSDSSTSDGAEFFPARIESRDFVTRRA